MKQHLLLGAALLAAVSFLGTAAAEGPKSGPQVGEKIPGPFHPLNINGTGAGKKHCLVCEHGTSPVAMVFARELTPAVSALIKKLEEATGKNSGANLGSFVVFCSDDEKLQPALKTLVEKEKLKNVALAIDNPAGPNEYKVAKDADVTVVLYSKHEIKVNQSFKKGELTEKDADKIVGELTKILPAK